jgi:hypothetical protein
MIRSATWLAAVLAAALFPSTGTALSDVGYYLPPWGAPYRAEEVRVRSPAGMSLGGILTFPEPQTLYPAGSRPPAVVLVGPGGGRDRDGAFPSESGIGNAPFRPFYDLSDTLSRRGVAVLRLDDRGVGASTGRRDSVVLLDRVQDLRAALEFLRRERQVDIRRISLLGMGDGAAVVSVVAATDTALAGVVVLLPDSDAGARITSPTPRPEDPLAAIRGFTAPALVLQGTGGRRPDSVAPHFIEMLQASGNHDVTRRTLRGLDDVFEGLELRGVSSAGARATVPADVRGVVADWLVVRREVALELPPEPVHRRSLRARR